MWNFSLCWFWRFLWTKAVVFHLTSGYMFPPLHSPPQGNYFPGRRALPPLPRTRADCSISFALLRRVLAAIYHLSRTLRRAGKMANPSHPGHKLFETLLKCMRHILKHTLSFFTWDTLFFLHFFYLLLLPGYKARIISSRQGVKSQITSEYCHFQSYL